MGWTVENKGRTARLHYPKLEEDKYMHMPLLVDGRWRGQFGIARYAREILAHIPEAHMFTGGPAPSHVLDGLYTSWLLARFKPRRYFSPGYNAPALANDSVVFTIHDLIHLRCEDKNGRLKALYYNAVIKPAARRSFRVVTVSEFSRAEIIEWAGLSSEQVVVVTNGCSETFSPLGLKYSPAYPYFFFVGAQKVHKNIDRILMSFARSELAPQIRFLFTGSPTRATAAAIERSGLGSYVDFIGKVSDADLASYYRGALALITPSLYEGFGLPVLEAMACGTPVLGSQATSIPEVAGDAALLVNPYDLDAIADGMQRLASDSTMCATLSAAGLRNSERFSWVKSAAKMRKLLLDD